jgi:hypothetical protein
MEIGRLLILPARQKRGCTPEYAEILKEQPKDNCFRSATSCHEKYHGFLFYTAAENQETHQTPPGFSALPTRDRLLIEEGPGQVDLLWQGRKRPQGRSST